MTGIRVLFAISVTTGCDIATACDLNAPTIIDTDSSSFIDDSTYIYSYSSFFIVFVAVLTNYIQLYFLLLTSRVFFFGTMFSMIYIVFVVGLLLNSKDVLGTKFIITTSEQPELSARCFLLQV